MTVAAPSTRPSAMLLAPEIFTAELTSWLTLGRRPDDRLLAAILENDLAAVFAYIGFHGEWQLVSTTIGWLANFSPVRSWGSAAAVATWEKRGGLAPGTGRRIPEITP